jgi:hypothetical protein
MQISIDLKNKTTKINLNDLNNTDTLTSAVRIAHKLEEYNKTSNNFKCILYAFTLYSCYKDKV